MAGSGAKSRWGPVLRYTFGGTLGLIGVVATQAGLQWYWSVIGFCTVFIIILGSRRIFRAGVSRTTGDIVCRYIPWYEGNAYIVLGLIPLMGVAMVGAGFDPGNPVWLRFGGIILLGLMPLLVFSALRLWRRSLLHITPSALTVRVILRLAPSGDVLTEIPRERVQSITPKVVTNGMSKSLQVEIVYHAAEPSSDTTKTVLMGLHLTVRPINLVNALITWQDAAINDPRELLDLIEHVLRGRSLAGVTPPPSRSALDAHPDPPPDDSHHD